MGFAVLRLKPATLGSSRSGLRYIGIQQSTRGVLAT